MKNGKYCQSCAMPLKSDPQGGGTEADGMKSREYCSFCYQDGMFVKPEVDTPQKMQAWCIEKLRERGTPGIIAWALTRGIPRLDRWKR